MKVLFLFPYPLKESPSQRFRFEQYLELLKSKNISIKTQSFWDTKTWNILYKKGFFIKKTVGLLGGFIRRFFILFEASHYDFVFIHRECTPVGPPVFEWIIAKVWRKKIIYDFDDAIWLPDQAKESWPVRILKWRSKVKMICRWSDKVSCGNEYLQKFGLQFNHCSVYNPTTIDTVHLHNPLLYKKKNSNSKITIGWTGTHSTLNYLNELVPVLQRIEKENSNVKISIIANRAPGLPFQSLKFIPWNINTEIEDLFQFDIGIMPLSDDEWSKGKCGFKALQYMALGITTIASPVGVNKDIIDNGINGFLCSSQDDWINKLSELIQNEKLRKKIGEQGKTTVEQRYSVDSNSSNFLSLFE